VRFVADADIHSAHSRTSGNPVLWPKGWVPAFAGTSEKQADSANLENALMPHAVVDGDAAFVDAEHQIVLERIDVRRRHVRIVQQVALRVEGSRGIAAFAPSEVMVVLQRIDAGRRYIGVVRQIARRIEQLVRIASLVPAEDNEVQQRIDPGGRDVGIVEQVVFGFEAAADLADRRVGLAALVDPELQVVRERIDAGRRDVRIAQQIDRRVEIRSRVAPGAPPLS
jgi:hypothetical protein